MLDSKKVCHPGGGGNASQTLVRCRLCTCSLNEGEGDDFELELCSSCKGRPEARRLGIRVLASPSRAAGAGPRSNPARDFTAAEKGLIQKVHGYMPAAQLLSILNERLVCDLGPDATPYSMEQLHAEIGDQASVTPAGGHDWPSLRKLLAKAKRAGTLDSITEQVINDFAVVFSLNQKQVLVLKDIVLPAVEE